MPPESQPTEQSVQPNPDQSAGSTLSMPRPAGMPAPPPQNIPSEPAKVVSPNSTQNSLLISEIRDGIVVMNDGSFRAVVACQSINFDLMSTREREGVEYSYQSFLNSLYFPIQILVRSQRVDIGPYLDQLTGIRRDQDNMLLGVLMDDYINFIDILAEEANIMDKSFFIVVPYFPAGDLSNVVEQSKGLFGKLFQKQTPVTHIDHQSYTKAKEEVKNRVDAVTSGLFQMGVRSVALNTKELARMYYNVYNPDTATREVLGDFENVTSTYVKKGEGEAPRPQLGGGGL